MKRCSRVLAVAIALTGCSSTVRYIDASPQVLAGDRITVVNEKGRERVIGDGRVVTVSGEEVEIGAYLAEPVELRPPIESVEYDLRRCSVIGSLIGGVVGLAIGMGASRSPDVSQCRDPAVCPSVRLGASGVEGGVNGLLAATLGLLVGLPVGQAVCAVPRNAEIM